jgi:hypothetical protein
MEPKRAVTPGASSVSAIIRALPRRPRLANQATTGAPCSAFSDLMVTRSGSPGPRPTP